MIRTKDLLLEQLQPSDADFARLEAIESDPAYIASQNVIMAAYERIVASAEPQPDPDDGAPF